MIVYLSAGSELRLRLHPNVDFYTRKVEAPDGSSVRDILKLIDLDPKYIAFVYSEGKIKKLDYVPRDGEKITLQPPVSGG